MLIEDVDDFRPADYSWFAVQVAKKFGKTITKNLGHGAFGFAFKTSDNKVIKITTNPYEADTCYKVLGKKMQSLCNIEKVVRVVHQALGDSTLYAIVMECLEPLNSQERETFQIFDDAYYPGIDWEDFRDELIAKNGDVSPEFGNAAKDFFMQVNFILKEMEFYKIGSNPDIHLNNMGKKNGRLGAFDLSAYTQGVTHDTLELAEQKNKKF